MTESYVAKSHLRAVVRAELEQYVATVLAQAVGQAVGDLVRECERRCEAKLDNAMKQFVFKGAWAENQKYRQRNLVSMGGAVYYCQTEDGTDARPGVGTTDWVLLVPKPRDGRDYVPPEPPEPRTVRAARSSSPSSVVAARNNR
jgi:hypothetical protein